MKNRFQYSHRINEDLTVNGKLWVTPKALFLDIFLNDRIYTTERADSVESMLAQLDIANWPRIPADVMQPLREMVENSKNSKDS